MQLLYADHLSWDDTPQSKWEQWRHGIYKLGSLEISRLNLEELLVRNYIIFHMLVTEDIDSVLTCDWFMKRDKYIVL